MLYIFNMNFLLLFLCEKILISIMIGSLVFLIIPTIIIMNFETWNFLNSFYFSLVTLFTIGFGDFVAGNSIFFHEISKKINIFLSNLKMCFRLRCNNVSVTSCCIQTGNLRLDVYWHGLHCSNCESRSRIFEREC